MTDARTYVEERMATERADLVKRRDEAQRSVKKLDAAYTKASKAHDKLVTSNVDGEETDKERAARVAKDAALKRLWGTLDAISACNTKIDKIDNPAELERRIAIRERLDQLGTRNTTQEERDMAGSKKLSDEKKAEIIGKVVAATKETGSYTRAAEKLNADKVPTLGKSPTWYTQIVRAAVIASGEKVTLKPQPRKTADKPPAATVKLGKNGTGSNDVTPDPKPTGKRSTAKRAGKRPTAKRSTAKRVAAKTAAAKRGGAKRSTAKRSGKR